MTVAVRPPHLVLAWWICTNCGTKLMRLYLAPGSVVEVKCPRCNCVATREAA